MDEGHDVTEIILKELESDVSDVYSKAAEETERKLREHLRKFKIKDRAKREALRRGEITRAEYRYWKTGQIAIGKRWEEMRNVLARDYHNANVVARSTLFKRMPDAYAIGHNYGTFQVEVGAMVDTSYTLYDRSTVERLILEKPELLKPPGARMNQTFADFYAYKNGEPVDLTPKMQRAFDRLIGAGKDIKWQEGQLQSAITQSILQGESVPNAARRIASTMSEINRAATLRYARTAINGAENAGRVDSYKRAEDMGIKLEQQWVATLDSRTRDSHRLMDGEAVPVGEQFSNGCEYPGDPDGPPEEIWNCRCTLIANVEGFHKNLSDLSIRRSNKLEGMTYDEWKYEHSKKG